MTKDGLPEDELLVPLEDRSPPVEVNGDIWEMVQAILIDRPDWEWLMPGLKFNNNVSTIDCRADSLRRTESLMIHVHMNGAVLRSGTFGGSETIETFRIDDFDGSWVDMILAALDRGDELI